MMITDEHNQKPIPEETLTCGYCGDIIDKSKGFYHEDITDWINEDHGISEDFYYHRGCYRVKMEQLHNNSQVVSTS